MQEESREFASSDLDGALEYVRALAARGATTVWLEVWTGRGWELSYGSDPAGVLAHMAGAWEGRARMRIRRPGEAREPDRSPAD